MRIKWSQILFSCAMLGVLIQIWLRSQWKWRTLNVITIMYVIGEHIFQWSLRLHIFTCWSIILSIKTFIWSWLTDSVLYHKRSESPRRVNSGELVAVVLDFLAEGSLYFFYYLVSFLSEYIWHSCRIMVLILMRKIIMSRHFSANVVAETVEKYNAPVVSMFLVIFFFSFGN